MARKQVFYYHALSSPWAYLGWPKFKALIDRHDLDVVVRPTRIVPENGGVPLRSRPQPRLRAAYFVPSPGAAARPPRSTRSPASPRRSASAS